METTMNDKKKRQVLDANMKVQIMKYIVICTFLTVVNWLTSPHYWWVLWVIAGWGLNLIMSLITRYFIKDEEK